MITLTKDLSHIRADWIASHRNRLDYLYCTANGKFSRHPCRRFGGPPAALGLAKSGEDAANGIALNITQLINSQGPNSRLFSRCCCCGSLRLPRQRRRDGSVGASWLQPGPSPRNCRGGVHGREQTSWAPLGPRRSRLPSPRPTSREPTSTAGRETPQQQPSADRWLAGTAPSPEDRRRGSTSLPS